MNELYPLESAPKLRSIRQYITEDNREHFYAALRDAVGFGRPDPSGMLKRWAEDITHRDLEVIYELSGRGAVSRRELPLRRSVNDLAIETIAWAMDCGEVRDHSLAAFLYGRIKTVNAGERNKEQDGWSAALTDEQWADIHAVLIDRIGVAWRGRRKLLCLHMALMIEGKSLPPLVPPRSINRLYQMSAVTTSPSRPS